MIQLTDNLRINKNAPVDDRLGVYASTAEALTAIASDRRYLGLTVLIEHLGSATEYWFENGILDADLVVKNVGTTQVNADWNATSGVAQILNKPTIPSAQVNSDWNASSGVAQILNKPTIPDAQVNSDWNATSGVSQILNKPTIPSITGLVPYTGATSDLNLGTNNITANNLFEGFSSVTASATQIVLTINSKPSYLVTGSGGQTIKLPNATTLPNGAIFDFNNNQSSGAILVNNNSNTLIKSIPSGGYLVLTLIDNSTSAGSWDAHFQAPSNVSWSSNTFDYTGSITSATWNGVSIADNRIASATTWNAKEDSANKQTDLTSSDIKFPTVNAVNTGLATKEPTITAGTTAQYWRGDKSWQTLNSTAVGLGNVNNTSDANKPISTATQTALNNITTLFQDVSQLSTTSTTSATLTTFTVASSSIPVGGIIRIVGLIEKTAGTGNTSLGININSAGAKYFMQAGQAAMQFEILIAKMTSTTVRYGLGASSSTAASYVGQTVASTSATQDGSGNFVISVLGFVGTAGATLTLQFIKGNLL